jgi:hypothetical protein
MSTFRRWQIGLLSALALLVALKGWAAYRSSHAPQYAFEDAFYFAIFFGFPQLVWFAVVAMAKDTRTFGVTRALIAWFVVLFVLAGYIPLPNAQYDQHHFEVPFVLLGEIVGVVLAFLAIPGGRSQNEGT